MPYLTDRTRILKQQQCPRSRYYHSEINGIGIGPSAISIALLKGLACHEGLQSLNKQVMQIQSSGEVGNGVDVDLAVKAALDYFETEVQKAEMEIEEGTNEAYVYAEQRALIEFCTRGYAISRLPHHIITYQMMSVEKELLMQLADDLVLMTRLDGLEQRVDTSGLYVYEFKTSFAWDSPNAKKRTIEDEHRVSMQALSNLIMAEVDAEHPMSGINMEFFINGSRREDKKDKVYKQDTWTIRPWAKRNVVGPDDYAWQYWYTDRMGFDHNLGSYTRVNIWEVMEIKEWVEMLANLKVQPDLGDPLSKVFIAPVPYERSTEDIRSWITATVAQELRVIEGLDRINNASNPIEKQQLLDEYFPKYTHSCINKYKKYCPFYIICHGELYGMDDPRESGLFKNRQPHHEAEILAVEGD